MFTRSFLASLLLVCAQQASALVISVDSDLDDWLAKKPEGKSSDWTPRSDADIKWAEEDQRNGYLNPGWGGQKYDAEAIYVNRSDGFINIAVVTGRAPNGSGWAAGDLAIDFGNDGVFEVGVVSLTDSTGIGAAGDLYLVDAWDYGIWSAPGVAGDPDAPSAFSQKHPTTVKAGTDIGDVDLSYGDFAYGGETGLDLGEYGHGGKHYVIETAIPISMLATHFDAETLNDSFLVHWTMACANDFVEVDPPGMVPIPAPLSLLVIGLLALATRRARRD